MTPETRILVQYHLDRAHEALAEAVLLLDSGYANTGGEPPVLCLLLCRVRLAPHPL